MKDKRTFPGVLRPGFFWPFIIFCFLSTFPTTHFSTVVFNKVETKHFEILFTQESEYAARELYEKAEEVYSKVSTFLGYEIRERIKVYVVKDHDYVNAYADPVFNSIVIYPNIPSGAIHLVFPNFESWMEFVFTHELIHVFIGSRLAWYFQPFSVLGKPVSKALQALFIPMYVHEGIAVYGETVFSNSGRLRYPYFLSLQETAHDGLGYAGGANTRHQSLGGLAYVQGSSFLYFLSEEYGEETMFEIVKRFLDNPVLGLGHAISNVLGNSDEVLFKWRNWIKKRYNRRFQESSDDEVDPEGWMLKPSPEGSIAYVDLRGIHVGSKSIPVVGLVDYSISKRGELAVVKYVQQNAHVWNFLIVEGKKIDEHVVDVAWKDEKHLWAIKQDGSGRRSLVEYVVNEEGFSQRKLLPPFPDFEPLELAEGDPSYIVGRYRSQVDLFHYDPVQGVILKLTDSKEAEENPSFSQDFSGICFLTSESSGTSVWLLKKEPRGYSVRKLLTSTLALTNPVAEDGRLFFSYVSKDGRRRVRWHTLEESNPETAKTLQPETITFSEKSPKSFNSSEEVFNFPVPRFWLPAILPEREGITFGVALGLVDDYNMSFATPMITNSGIHCLFGYLKNPQILLWLGPKPWLNAQWRLSDVSSLTGDGVTLSASYNEGRLNMGLSCSLGRVTTRYLSSPKVNLRVDTNGLELTFYHRSGDSIMWIGTASHEDEILRTGIRVPLALLDLHTKFGYAFLDWIDLSSGLKLGNSGSYEFKLSVLIHGGVHYFFNFTLEAGILFNEGGGKPFWRIGD